MPTASDRLASRRARATPSAAPGAPSSTANGIEGGALTNATATWSQWVPDGASWHHLRANGASRSNRSPERLAYTWSGWAWTRSPATW